MPLHLWPPLGGIHERKWGKAKKCLQSTRNTHVAKDPRVVCSLGIKTHGSESRGQEEADLRDERVSYLQVAPL